MNGRDGDFEGLIGRYYHPLQSYYRRLGVPPDEIEDLTHEALLRIYTSIERYRGEGPFDAWVFTIARHTFFRWLKDRPDRLMIVSLEIFRQEGAQEPAAGGPSPEDAAALREVRAQLEALIETLPLKMRQCLRLWLKGKSSQEIGAEMGCSAATARVQIFKGRRRLEAMWRQLEQEEDRD